MDSSVVSFQKLCSGTSLADAAITPLMDYMIGLREIS